MRTKIDQIQIIPKAYDRGLRALLRIYCTKDQCQGMM